MLYEKIENNTKASRRYGRPPYAAVCLLESGAIRGNMLTRRFAFVPPLCRTNGIETAKRLRQRSALKGVEDTILIFITGIREYVFEAFDVAVFHYLLKPIEENKFREVFHRAERELEKRKSKRRETVFIKTRNRSFSLEKDSILYIESRGKKVEIHTTGETIEAYASMNEMEGYRG